MADVWYASSSSFISINLLSSYIYRARFFSHFHRDIAAHLLMVIVTNVQFCLTGMKIADRSNIKKYRNYCCHSNFVVNTLIAYYDSLLNFRIYICSKYLFRISEILVKHAPNICLVCFYKIRQLRQIRRYFNFDVAATLARSFVMHRVDY